ncbi:MAG: Bug family tripartite tricarboxylate transporter substrate binding protein [Burkholderiales bacterium]
MNRAAGVQLFVVLIGVSLCNAAQGQSYPAKPLRMVVPFQAGAGGDITARVMAGSLAENLGQAIIVENRAGAGEAIAAENIAKSAPDGYSIFYCSSNALVLRPNLAKVVAYDPVKDFTPIFMTGRVFAAIVVNPSLGVNSLQGLIDYARANPGKLSYGTSGVGTTHHLGAEQIMQLTATHMVHVPYKSGIQPINDLVSGLIPVTFTIMSTLTPFLKAGKVRVIAVDSAGRHRALPEVQSINETLPAFIPAPTWTGIVGPARLPQAIVARLNSELYKVIAKPEMLGRLESNGYEVVGSTPEAFGDEIKRGLALVAKLVKSAGIQPTE